MRKQDQIRAASDCETYIDASSARFGCWTAVALYAGLVVWLFLATVSAPGILHWGLLVFLIPVLLYFGSELWELALLGLVEIRWRHLGIRALLVYSNSPKWRARVEQVWLPRLGRSVTILNWSERKAWQASLATRIFRRFAGVEDFNPCVIVFRGLGKPTVFRFYRPFLDAARGHEGLLVQLEDRLFECLGADQRPELPCVGEGPTR